MSWNLTTSAACLAKAGKNCVFWTEATSAAFMLKYCNDAENYLNTLTRYDWVTNIASVGAQFSGALSDIISSLVAMNMINYDMSGYTSRAEAQTMLDVLWNNAQIGIKELQKMEVQEILI